jgi:hypothetical protein
MTSTTDRLPIRWEWGLELLEDEESVEIKEIITSLVGGECIPSVAAERLDSFIVNLTNTRLAAVEKRQSATITPKEEERGINCYDIGPHPRGSLWTLRIGILCAASTYPPTHAEQDRLLEFMEILSEMPAKKLPQATEDDLSGRGDTVELYKDLFGASEAIHDVIEFKRRT